MSSSLNYRCHGMQKVENQTCARDARGNQSDPGKEIVCDNGQHAFRLHSSAFYACVMKQHSKNFSCVVTFGDFSARIERACIVIFLLTSFFIDSIHSDSCNKRPLHSP